MGKGTYIIVIIMIYVHYILLPICIHVLTFEEISHRKLVRIEKVCYSALGLDLARCNPSYTIKDCQ